MQLEIRLRSRLCPSRFSRNLAPRKSSTFAPSPASWKSRSQRLAFDHGGLGVRSCNSTPPLHGYRRKRMGSRLVSSHVPHVFAIAKMRNLEDVFPRQALSTGWGGSFRDSENEKKRIQTEAITDGQRKRA